MGTGRALPQRGLSELQPGRNSKASRAALSGPKNTLIGFIGHRTPRRTPGVHKARMAIIATLDVYLPTPQLDLGISDCFAP